jgi:hypothetical protein
MVFWVFGLVRLLLCVIGPILGAPDSPPRLKLLHPEHWNGRAEHQGDIVGIPPAEGLPMTDPSAATKKPKTPRQSPQAVSLSEPPKSGNGGAF